MCDTLQKAVEKAEIKVINEALQYTKNNRTKAAAVLNVDRKTLYNKMAQYKIK